CKGVAPALLPKCDIDRWRVRRFGMQRADILIVTRANAGDLGNFGQNREAHLGNVRGGRRIKTRRTVFDHKTPVVRQAFARDKINTLQTLRSEAFQRIAIKPADPAPHASSSKAANFCACSSAASASRIGSRPPPSITSGRL